MAYSESYGEKNGFEALRLVTIEYMVRSRQEIMHFRNNLLSRVFKSGSVTELVKQMEFEESRYEKLLNMLPSGISKSGLEMTQTSACCSFAHFLSRCVSL